MSGKSVPTFGEALQQTKKVISQRLVLSAESDGINQSSEAEQLLMASVEKTTGHSLSRLDLYSRIQDPFPSQAAWDCLLAMASLRAQGKPLQYITGIQGFLDHDYQVGPGVLIPRPESEILARTAITTLLATHRATVTGAQQESITGIEIGVGSGILSVELLSQFSNLKMTASELSPVAEKYARLNARKILGEGENGEGRLEILQVTNPLEVLEPFLRSSIRASFLITNPPYLKFSRESSNGEVEAEADVIMHEPHAALFAPTQDPVYFYRKIAESAFHVLKEEGFVFAEVPHERAQSILALFQDHGWTAELLKDLNQRDRVLVAKLNKKKF